VTFADIPAGDSVFLDANVFVYDFGPDPVFGPPSRVLLERVEQGEVNGYMSTRTKPTIGPMRASVGDSGVIRGRSSNFVATDRHWGTSLQAA
jgi:hypothetical protein